MQYVIHIASLIGIYIIVALSYALPVGYTGLLQLGHVGLFAIGAYTAAILTIKGFSFGIAVLIAILITSIVGFLFALPTRRIRSDYYALMTLGFVFLINAVLLNWISLTEGPFGISGIDRPRGFNSPELFLLLIFLFDVLVGLFIYRLTKSPFGRALESVRDDELLAESLGKNVFKLKVVSLTISAGLVGIAGALLTYFIQFINPQLFFLDNAVWILAALVIGGLASFRGAILGTILIFGMFEGLRFLPISIALVGPLRLILFSLLLLFVVLFRPKGMMGRAELE
jgi:branched-chain amino acid transport system permease protein